eukprot:scaffold521_cov308-Prasinococcus_capsulatus_cf.AAC.5
MHGHAHRVVRGALRALHREGVRERERGGTGRHQHHDGLRPRAQLIGEVLRVVLRDLHLAVRQIQRRIARRRPHLHAQLLQGAGREHGRPVLLVLPAADRPLPRRQPIAPDNGAAMHPLSTASPTCGLDVRTLRTGLDTPGEIASWATAGRPPDSASSRASARARASGRWAQRAALERPPAMAWSLEQREEDRWGRPAEGGAVGARAAMGRLLSKYRPPQ